MTLRSGSGQACAACKFQRRRCNPQCLLAPFFPADQPQIFYNVHRLFGVKHIQKLLKELHPHQRPVAINSVKFHAAMRHKYPVYGCLVEIQNLAYQIDIAKLELQAVLQQLIYHRQQMKQEHEQEQETRPSDDYLSQQQLQLGMGQYNLASSPPNNINGDRYNKECNDVDTLWMQRTYDNNENSMVMQSQITAVPHNMIIPQESQDFSEVYSFFDNIDDRQSYIVPKEVYEFRLDSSVRDCTQSDEQMAENELKNAAACFSLTSFN